MNDFLSSLAPPDPNNRGTGAILRMARVTDWQMLGLPELPQAIAAGLAPKARVVPMEDVRVVYNQGSRSKCVASSECGAKTIQDYLDSGKRLQIKYDDEELYRACGGPEDGSTGIFTDAALARGRDVGCLEEGGSGIRRKLAGYAWAPQIPNVFRETIAAAVQVGRPCVLATLLPSQFGWISNEVLTSSYHQMMVNGHDGLRDEDHVELLNSWGVGHGLNGFERLTWRYLESRDFQSRYVYAYTLLDVDDLPDTDPVPPKPDELPVITRAKYKNLKKVLVDGKNFDPTATLLLDGQETNARPIGNKFVYLISGLPVGTHTAQVVNPKDKTSAPQPFNVKAQK